MSHEEFIGRARLAHGDTYDYSQTVYADSQLSVTVVCRVHGSFLQKASAHIGGKGCAKCGMDRSIAGLKRRAQGARDFFEACRKVHGGKYEYPDQEYMGKQSKIAVRCPEHGLFEIDAGPHLRLQTGCQQCGYLVTANAKKHSVESWMTRARAAHGDRFEYDTHGWDGVMTSIRIRCGKHGWFEQQALKHVQGQACPQCAVERLTGRWNPNTMTPEHAAEPCVLYYLHFTSDDESFYKIGISSKLRRRLYVLRTSGYNVRLVHQISGDRRSCLELEIQTFTEFDAVAAYVPRKPFDGDGECFAWDVLQLDGNAGNNCADESNPGS